MGARLIMVALLIGIAALGLGVKELTTPASVTEVTCGNRVLPVGDFCVYGGDQFSYEEMLANQTQNPEKSREGIALVAFGGAAVVGFGAWTVYRLARKRRGR